jgi:hypothetical protein
MDNSQYHIPDTYSQSEPAEDLFASLDKQQYTPETQPAAFKHLKDIEAKIHDYRLTAIQTGQANIDRPWLRAMGAFKQKRVTIDSLIEAESHRGGALFGEGHQFWLHTQSAHPMEQDKSDWFYRRNSLASNVPSHTIHYQITEHEIHKLYNGRPVPLEAEEQAHVGNVIVQYEKNIRPLYPLDGTLADIQDEAATDELPKVA